MSIFEVKPVCSVHKRSIEQISGGVATWICPEKSCKGKEFGYSNKLISEIWMKIWNDESELEEFRRSIGFYEELFNTPSEILIASVEKFKEIELIVEEIQRLKEEYLIKEQKKLASIEDRKERANLSSDFIKSMVKKSNSCPSCGIVPAFNGSCGC